MTDYDKAVYEHTFPGLPLWKVGDLVRVADGPDMVNGELGRVQSLKRKETSYCHFDCIVEVGSRLYHCLPDVLEEPGVLELLADEA